MSSKTEFYIAYKADTLYSRQLVEVFSKTDAETEEDAIAWAQEFNLNEFTVLQSVGTYRKSRPVVNYEKV